MMTALARLQSTRPAAWSPVKGKLISDRNPCGFLRNWLALEAVPRPPGARVLVERSKRKTKLKSVSQH